MLICHCNRVTDREITAVVQAGASSVDEVTDLCGAAGDCGGCADAVEELIEGERRRLSVLSAGSGCHLAARDAEERCRHYAGFSASLG